MVEYTNFSLRHFDPNTKMTKIDLKYKETIIAEIEESIYYKKLVDSPLGDFCKYVVIHNDYGVESPLVNISRIKNRWVRTKYEARQEHELPVLVRYAKVPRWFKPEQSKYLIAVLYSREQLLKEYNSRPQSDSFEIPDNCEWGIVTILASNDLYPDPMPPITMMRNALGIEEGGNGVNLDKSEYEKSVEFWNNNILIKKTKKLW